MQAAEPGRSSAGAQQMQRREEIEAARRPPGFRAGGAVPASWDADEDHKLAGVLICALRCVMTCIEYLKPSYFGYPLCR